MTVLASPNVTAMAMDLPARQAGQEPIPGYRLVEPLGSGGFGEVWRCDAPGGLAKALKFVHGRLDGLGGGGAEQELQALERVKAIRHPFILSLDRIQVVDGQLLIVMELADESLADVRRACQGRGLPGVPRDQLLAYLREAAEALDLLNLRHGLLHLDVKPGNLFLVGNHVKVGDFGLVHDLRRRQTDDGGGRFGALSPVYAAPETFSGRVCVQSDQYSLAIVYQELLTGKLPFKGKNLRQLAVQHARQEPEVQPLPPEDRDAVLRALAKEARQRFSSCTDFVRALGGRAAAPRPAPEKADAGSPGPAKATTPAAGYRFVECIGQGPLGETWLVREGDGPLRQAKLVVLSEEARRRELLGNLERLQQLSHPALPPVEVVPFGPDRWLVLTDPATDTLWQEYQQCRARGLPGLARRDLLDRLAPAAAALDALRQHHDLPHLALTPHALFHDDQDRPRLADFGLAALLGLPRGLSAGDLNPRYAAPECFDGPPGPSADQYSLALIYVELLTGCPPARAVGRRRAGPARGEVQLDLGLLSASDRAVLARALYHDPAQRFAGCGALIEALEGAAQDDGGAGSLVAAVPVVVPVEDGDLKVGVASPLAAAGPKVIADLVRSVAGPTVVVDIPGGRYLLQPGRAILARCTARVPPGVAPLKLAGFREQWRATALGAADEEFVFLVGPAPTLWQRWRGQRTGLRVDVRLERSASATNGLAYVHVMVVPDGGGDLTALLHGLGPQLVQSLRSHLQALPDLRGQERIAWSGPLNVRPILPDRRLAGPIAAEVRDISLTGIGFVSPKPLTASQVYVHSPRPEEAARVALLANVVRVLSRPDGQFLVGASFPAGADPAS